MATVPRIITQDNMQAACIDNPVHDGPAFETSPHAPVRVSLAEPASGVHGIPKSGRFWKEVAKTYVKLETVCFVHEYFVVPNERSISRFTTQRMTKLIRCPWFMIT